MSDSGNEKPSTVSLGQIRTPVPVDSGTRSAQTAIQTMTTGELLPRGQLGEILPNVGEEAAGLIMADAANLQGLAAQRLFASYAAQLSQTNEELLRELNASRDRERTMIADAHRSEMNAQAEIAGLTTKVAVAGRDAKATITNRRLHTLLSVLGLAVASLGADQFADGKIAAGVFLGLIGLATAAAGHWIGGTQGE